MNSWQRKGGVNVRWIGGADAFHLERAAARCGECEHWIASREGGGGDEEPRGGLVDLCGSLDLLHACEVRPVLSLRFLLPSAPGELPGPSKWSSGDDGSSSVLGVIVDIGAVGCVWRVVVRRL